MATTGYVLALYASACVGATVGFLAAAMCFVAKQSDQAEDRARRY
jgi:hypothetical protein